jgi:rRNA maturation RNase YbeY
VIEVVNRQRLVRVVETELADTAASVLAADRRAGDSLTIALVRDRVMRALNRDYRGKDRPTDVLSFPASRKVHASRGHTRSRKSYYLGDVVISTDSAVRQAGEAGHPLVRELHELVIHGTLHLCGYNHEKDNGEMNRLELRLRRRLLGKLLV